MKKEVKDHQLSAVSVKLKLSSFLLVEYMVDAGLQVLFMRKFREINISCEGWLLKLRCDFWTTMVLWKCQQLCFLRLYCNKIIWRYKKEGILPALRHGLYGEFIWWFVNKLRRSTALRAGLVFLERCGIAQSQQECFCSPVRCHFPPWPRW